MIIPSLSLSGWILYYIFCINNFIGKYYLQSFLLPFSIMGHGQVMVIVEYVDLDVLDVGNQ